MLENDIRYESFIKKHDVNAFLKRHKFQMDHAVISMAPAIKFVSLFWIQFDSHRLAYIILLFKRTSLKLKPSITLIGQFN